MLESVVTGLFPTPVYVSKLDRNLSKKELQFVDKCKLKSHENKGNRTSNDNYVLNKKIFSKLKKEIEIRIKDYVDNVILATNDVTPYITQSWLNYTETNEFHHKHAHPNSYISGVFYINCLEEHDKIYFYKDKYQLIKPDVKEYNVFNSENWWFSVKTGDIILFPSYLPHMVETKKGNNTRISLAFNVFLKGKIGNNKALTELKLT